MAISKNQDNCQTRRVSASDRLIAFQGLQDGADAGDFVGAEEVGLAEGGENGEEGFGATDFLAKELEGVGQGVADGKTKGAKAKGVEEDLHLMADAGGAVLEIAVVEAEAGVEEKFGGAASLGAFDKAGEMVAHGGNDIGAEGEVADGAGVFALDVAEDEGGVVRGDEMEKVVRGGVAGPIEDAGAGFEAGAGEGDFVGFDRNEDADLSQGGDDGGKRFDLGGGVDAGGVGEGGFGAEIDEVGALGLEEEAALDGLIGAEADAFAVPGIGREIDHAHDGGFAVEGDAPGAEGEFGDARADGGGVIGDELGEVFEAQHGGKDWRDSGFAQGGRFLACGRRGRA